MKGQELFSKELGKKNKLTFSLYLNACSSAVNNPESSDHNIISGCGVSGRLASLL